ncbi:hypothetical protein LEP1GSC133_5167 [Leptospira borgpetersenii serovar Pomona str. 200901868]|uniref:Uncharacterized protein n=4 Tax=Leptospira borgpetersenii TaxID=174 RepID=M3GH13_LEPBO|nr:hypothetical protein LEP1GSC128_1894 [Leptospira borgpetersenii str. 200801926]EMG00267.1 hypothetical protein LEP1GSC123_2269 [Leptospira borgpetersenii str. 200701203]EMK08492.1 hypothetical protein LEP1GSC066_1161 [Leptospira sp. serovar Kenya str. Sh9]EMN14393.1 hypothetical protein LEP1GSC055_4147 [Leptospira borgpetersenii str. Brem 307]EMN16093.1 hypothetical protein LEP1GSC056_0807 [Leptospira borgpetersenii str. Brem 328]EMO60894.1 hypothetical protein LEP1GSC133_5167 [Leptospira b
MIIISFSKTFARGNYQNLLKTALLDLSGLEDKLHFEQGYPLILETLSKKQLSIVCGFP